MSFLKMLVLYTLLQSAHGVPTGKALCLHLPSLPIDSIYRETHSQVIGDDRDRTNPAAHESAGCVMSDR